MAAKIAKTMLLKTLQESIIWGVQQLWAITPRLMTLMAITALFESALPACLALSTRFLINRISDILNSGIHPFSAVLIPLLITLLVIILQNGCTAVKVFLFQTFRDKVNLKISCVIMRHASKHDVVFFENSDNQDMLARINQNTATHLSSCFVNVLTLASDLIKLSSLSIILIVIEPLLGLVIVPLFIPYLSFKIRLAKDRFTIHSSQTVKKRWTQYFVRLLTQPEKVAEIKLLGIAEYFLQKFKNIMFEFNVQGKDLYKRSMIGNIIFSTIANLVIFAILCRIILRVIAGALTMGDVVIFIGTSANLRNLLENTTSLLGTMHEHASYIGNFKNFLNHSEKTDEGQNESPATLTNGAVELKNVSFTYPGAKNPTLNNISLKIYPGETVALVGENATGKTTLAKLIAGLYKPDSGTITIDGIDIQQCSQCHLQEKIAFVFQNFGKFEASVSDNIAVGNWQQLMHQEQQIETIARKVNLHHIVKDYPEGYNTLLGQLFGTYNPSGGQWQYIAIARAFAKDSALLILDEPTANLDVSSEYELFNRFKELASGRTTVLISHRFSTVKIADRIVVLGEKGVIENGTHRELLEQKGTYAAMFHVYKNQMDFDHIQ